MFSSDSDGWEKWRERARERWLRWVYYTFAFMVLWKLIPHILLNLHFIVNPIPYEALDNMFIIVIICHNCSIHSFSQWHLIIDNNYDFRKFSTILSVHHWHSTLFAIDSFHRWIHAIVQLLIYINAEGTHVSILSLSLYTQIYIFIIIHSTSVGCIYLIK